MRHDGFVLRLSLKTALAELMSKLVNSDVFS